LRKFLLERLYDNIARSRSPIKKGSSGGSVLRVE
jgi:hypothetical protein